MISEELIIDPLESWHFYGLNLDLARLYDYVTSYTENDTFFLFFSETDSSCTFTLTFEKKGVFFYAFNDEMSSVIRELEISIITQRDPYWEWPLFEVKHSLLIETVMSHEEFEALGLRHFVISTENMFIDIFATHEPEILVENKDSCSRKSHRKPKPLEPVINKN